MTTCDWFVQIPIAKSRNMNKKIKKKKNPNESITAEKASR